MKPTQRGNTVQTSRIQQLLAEKQVTPWAASRDLTDVSTVTMHMHIHNTKSGLYFPTAYNSSRLRADPGELSAHLIHLHSSCPSQ